MDDLDCVIADVSSAIKELKFPPLHGSLGKDEILELLERSLSALYESKSDNENDLYGRLDNIDTSVMIMNDRLSELESSLKPDKGCKTLVLNEDGLRHISYLTDEIRDQLDEIDWEVTY